MRRILVQWLLTVAAILITTPTFGHDSFVLLEGGKGSAGGLTATFITTDRFPKPDAATRPERVAEWVVIDHTRRMVLSEFSIDDRNRLVTSIPMRSIGTCSVAIALKPHAIELAFDKFREYLLSEGRIDLCRKLESRSKRAQRERYTKFSKTCTETVVGWEPSDEPPPVAGHLLELEPLTNPLKWYSGQSVAVRVKFAGKPLAGARVSFGSAQGGTREGEAVLTDAAGIARIQLARTGLCFIRTHLIREIDLESPDAAEFDWESFWASFVFVVIPEEFATWKIFADVEAIHGAPGPWAVAGYRMGMRALKELGLKRGSFDLEVIHETPMQVQYSCIADGIQAATGASAGKLNLKLKEVPLDRLRTVFRKRSTGETCVIELTGNARSRMLDVPIERLIECGRTIAGLPDEEFLTVHRAEETCHATTQAGAK